MRLGGIQAKIIYDYLFALKKLLNNFFDGIKIFDRLYDFHTQERISLILGFDEFSNLLTLIDLIL